MAKKSMINRDLKRTKLVEKFSAKRLELKKIIKSVNSTDEERFKRFLNFSLYQEMLHQPVKEIDVVYLAVLMVSTESLDSLKLN